MVEGEGPWLVLLHGFGSSLADWEAHRPILAKQFRVLTLDFRGFGMSSKDVGPFSVDQMADDLVALMDHLEIKGAHFVGYSMGGAVAFETTLNRPDLVDRLVLVNTWASFRPTTWRRKREKLFRTLTVRFISMDLLAKALGKRLFGKPGQEELLARFIERYSQNDRAVYLALLKTLPLWSVIDRLSEIDRPTLVLSAEEDYTPLSEKEAYTKLLPQATLEIIEGTGHGAPFERLEWFCERIAQFVVDQA